MIAIYNGLDKNANVSFIINNGFIVPESFENATNISKDQFLKDIYEIAINNKIVEVSVSNHETYKNNKGEIISNKFSVPVDDDSRDYGLNYEEICKSIGVPIGKSVIGNLGVTLLPGNASVSGKISNNNNIQIVINGRGNLNHQSIGLAHEFGHVLLYIRGVPHAHAQPGVDTFIAKRTFIMSKKLGYDH